jgi:hypothetical protein
MLLSWRRLARVGILRVKSSTFSNYPNIIKKLHLFRLERQELAQHLTVDFVKSLPNISSPTK